MKPEEEFVSRSPSVWKHRWAEELRCLAFRKRRFSFVIFCFLLVYRGGVARKDRSTQKQEGPPLAAGHLWPPRQEADIQPAVTDVFWAEGGHIYVHTPPSICWKLHVMFELFLCNKLDLGSFHFEAFCLKGWPLTLVLSDQYVHSSSVLHWLYAWATPVMHLVSSLLDLLLWIGEQDKEDLWFKCPSCCSVLSCFPTIFIPFPPPLEENSPSVLLLMAGQVMKEEWGSRGGERTEEKRNKQI